MHGHTVRCCQECKHQFHPLAQPLEDHVADIYSDDYFFGGGAGYDHYESEEELLVQSGSRYARVASKLRKPGRVLDVGAAAGFLLQGFVDAGWTGCGIEPNASMVESGRLRGLELQQGTFEEFADNHPAQFDLVNMIQVISHFVDPKRTLQLAHGLLEDSGLLLVETWDRNSWTAKGFGKRWHEYSPPSVLHWFSRDSLSELAGRCGFRELQRGRPVKKIKLGHAVSLLKHKMSSSGLGRIATSPLGLIPKKLKVSYPFDDVFWMIFQKKD